MAEKRIGTLSLSCGADAVRRLPFSSRSTRSVLRPRKVRVSMGSRRGVDGRVRHLRGVEQQAVPVDGVVLGVAHGGEQHPAGLRLAVDLLDGAAGPVGVRLEGVVGLDDLERARRAEGHAPVAADALALVRDHALAVRVVAVHLVCALPLAHAAGDAAVRVADDFVLGIEELDGHYASPPLLEMRTGSPPRGDQSASRFGSSARMAHSSLAM